MPHDVHFDSLMVATPWRAHGRTRAAAIARDGALRDGTRISRFAQAPGVEAVARSAACDELSMHG